METVNKTMDNEIAYYQIKKGHLTQGNFSKGYNITITMVGAYTSEGKWVKWVSLESFIEILINAKIKL